jgi:hypothetical protein
MQLIPSMLLFMQGLELVCSVALFTFEASK